MTYRALAFDLDGTLLDADSVLTPTVLRALKIAGERGVKVFLVSGRMVPSMVPYWRQLQLTTPLVGYNGAKAVRPPDPPLWSQTLPIALTREIIAYARARQWALQVYFNDMLYPLYDLPFNRQYAEFARVEFKVLPSNGELPTGEPNKALVVCEPEDLAAVTVEMTAFIAGRAEVVTSSGLYCEVMPRGVNKAVGLKHAAAAEGLTLAEIVAAGDGPNDREMLEQCGVGLAITTGDAELNRVIPRHIPAMPDGGIERVLDEFFGIKI
ncbi:haloacid dehalogenase [Planctomycetales bacterium]|nr:haloacid dehalogenase [Planctomycetales bacterium]GHT02069.1 haloacid dehalogenase [Planctomycetales bacterium]GHT07793.1 haloacid dehalogenase [Planctomycetales bacterium]